MGKHFLRVKVTSVFKQIIALAIILQISLGSTLGLAADSGQPPITQKEYSVFLPPELKKLAAEDFLKSDSQFTDNEKFFIEKYFNEPARVTLDLMILARALIEKADSIPGVSEKIKSRSSDLEVSVEIPGLGKAEFNSLGYKDSGKPFTRFVHYGTQTSYIFVDTDIVPLESLNAQEKAQFGVNAGIENRDRKISRGELDRYTAIQQMHTKVHPEEYNFFPNTEEINPEEAKDYLNDLIEHAKANPPKKKYDTATKIKTGRPVKIIGYSGKSQITRSLTEFQRYEDLSPLQRVMVYWRSVKQGTRLNWDYWDRGDISGKVKGFFTADVLVGLFSTAMQTGIFVSLKKGDVDPLSLFLVAGWAFAFSVTPTIRNWINVNPNKSSVLFKSFLNSVLFNYIMLIAIHGADTVFSLNQASFNMAALAITNAIINNFGKVWWYKIPQMRTRAGLNLREINLRNFKTKVDQSSIEQQSWYLGSNIFRTADLLAMGNLFSILSLEFFMSKSYTLQFNIASLGIDSSKISLEYLVSQSDFLQHPWVGNAVQALGLDKVSRWAMLFSIPVMHYFIMKYAEKKDFKEKEILRQEWEKANYLHWKGKAVTVSGFRIPIFYLGALKMFAQETWLIAKNSTMLFYWPGKVAFDALRSGSEYLVKQITKGTALPRPAPIAPVIAPIKAPPATRGNACLSMFS